MKAVVAALALLPMVSASYFKPTTKQELVDQIDACQPDGTFTTWDNTIATCNEVESWDTSLITDMRGIFNNKWTFNEDISAWDVSNVNDLAYMFRRDFNQDLSSWQIKPTAGLAYMFEGTAMNHQLCGAAWVDREQAGTIPGNMFAGSGSVATCDLCPAGQYAQTSNAVGDCADCPAGTESARAGQTFCVAPPPPAECADATTATQYQSLGCCNC